MMSTLFVRLAMEGMAVPLGTHRAATAKKAGFFSLIRLHAATGKTQKIEGLPRSKAWVVWRRN
jgi:hypothetical protein